MTKTELARNSIDVNLAYLQAQGWARQAARLGLTLTNAPDAEKAATNLGRDDHYDIREQPETSRAALMRNAVATIAARIMRDWHKWLMG